MPASHWIASRADGKTSITTRAAATLMGAIGSFDQNHVVGSILAVVRDAGVDSEACSFYAFESDAPPRHIASANVHDLSLSNSIAQRYVHEYYKYDQNRSFIAGHSHHRRQAPVIVTRQLSKNIERADYRQACYDSVGIADRLSVVVPLDGQTGLTISIYRPTVDGVFRESDVDCFKDAASLIGHAAAKHYRLLARHAPSPLTLLESRFKAIGSHLTRREHDVTFRILRGMTVAQISEDLDIKPTSVLTYRNRAYLRLGVQHKSDLYALLFNE